MDLITFISLCQWYSLLTDEAAQSFNVNYEKCLESGKKMLSKIIFTNLNIKENIF